MLARHLHAAGIQQLHDSLRRTRDESGLPSALGQLADAQGAEAVDILLGRDCRGDGVFRHVVWQRQLHEDAMDRGIVVVGSYAAEYVRLRGVHGQLDMSADNSCLGSRQ